MVSAGLHCFEFKEKQSIMAAGACVEEATHLRVARKQREIGRGQDKIHPSKTCLQ
jgi:hypothetical protein